jgi:hypothetical protein
MEPYREELTSAYDEIARKAEEIRVLESKLNPPLKEVKRELFWMKVAEVIGKVLLIPLCICLYIIIGVLVVKWGVLLHWNFTNIVGAIVLWPAVFPFLLAHTVFLPFICFAKWLIVLCL